jgi:Tfp pilus assembly protein PilO
MSGDMHGMPLVRRILKEHRRIVLPLLVALVINGLAYAFIVYPLSRQVADVEGRDERATQALQAARQEHAQAAGTLTGKDRAATELTTFYRSVLPSDVSSARRLVYLRLHQLAREAGLRYSRMSNVIVEARTSTLTRLKTEMELGGSYANMRAFIHQLETAPEFVVIDNVELTEGDQGGELRVKLELSTYFRTGA